MSIPIPFLRHGDKIYIQRNKHVSGPPCEPSDTLGLSAWCLENEEHFLYKSLLQTSFCDVSMILYMWIHSGGPIIGLSTCFLAKYDGCWHRAFTKKKGIGIYTLMTENPAGHRLATCRGSISSNMVPHSSSNTLGCFVLEVRSVKSPVEKQKRTQKTDPKGAIRSSIFWQRRHHSMQSRTLWFLQETLDT